MNEEQKEAIFIEFYRLGDYNKQNAYLFGLVRPNKCNKVHPKKRKVPTVNQRKVSFRYFILDTPVTEVEVCRTAFLAVHAISVKRLRTVRSN